MPQARHYVDEGSDEGGAVRCHAARYSETDDPRKSDMEARAGIEPAYTDLQSAASPLRHRASPAISRELGCYLRNRRSAIRSEEHTSELQSLMRTSYAVFCFDKHNHQYKLS